MKKEKRDSRILILRKIFNEADIQGIYFGDNPDEYDPEIDAIVKLLPQCDTVVKIKRALRLVFKDKFGADISGSVNIYTGLSEALFEWKKKQLV